LRGRLNISKMWSAMDMSIPGYTTPYRPIELHIFLMNETGLYQYCIFVRCCRLGHLQPELSSTVWSAQVSLGLSCLLVTEVTEIAEAIHMHRPLEIRQVMTTVHYRPGTRTRSVIFKLAAQTFKLQRINFQMWLWH
jgi:hypothetical protein